MYVKLCVVRLPRLRHQMLLSYTLVVMVCLVDWCVTMDFTAKEIYNFVHQGVVEASGNRQHPVMWGKFDGNMPVIKW